MKICQCCGKEIKLGEQAIEIKYGKMGATSHPHYKVFPDSKDFFHAACDVAIREQKQ